MKDFLIFFTKKLRLSNPWNYKVPFLMAIPYFVLFLNEYYKPDTVFGFLASVCIIVGVAGVGYLSNDLGDKTKDAQIKKANVTSALSAVSIFFLFVLFLSLSVGPWFYLPVNKWSVVLLISEFALFFIYAFPPFRFKEKGFLGVLTDSLYAHVVPAILASLTFQLFAHEQFAGFRLFVIILCSWQFFLGLRNIIFHQLKDFENDRLSGTHTFVTSIGIHKAEQLLKIVLLPAEIATFLVFILFITWYMHAFVFFVIGIWALIFILEKQKRTKYDYRSFAYLYFDDLYMKWLPLLILGAITYKSGMGIIVFVLHFVFFRNQLKTWVLQLLKINF